MRNPQSVTRHPARIPVQRARKIPLIFFIPGKNPIPNHSTQQNGGDNVCSPAPPLRIAINGVFLYEELSLHGGCLHGGGVLLESFCKKKPVLPHSVLPHKGHNTGFYRRLRSGHPKSTHLHRWGFEYLLVEPVANLVEDACISHAMGVNAFDPSWCRCHGIIGATTPAVFDMLTFPAGSINVVFKSKHQFSCR